MGGYIFFCSFSFLVQFLPFVASCLSGAFYDMDIYDLVVFIFRAFPMFGIHVNIHDLSIEHYDSNNLLQSVVK